MSKEQRDAEMERILDLAVADENTRLAAGGVSVGDVVDVSQVIEHEEQQYLTVEAAHREMVPIIRKIDEAADRDYDEYRELIEAEGPEAPPPNPDFKPMQTLAREKHIELIRAAVPSYPPSIRTQVGFLLEVIDAYAEGRL